MPGRRALPNGFLKWSPWTRIFFFRLSKDKTHKWERNERWERKEKAAGEKDGETEREREEQRGSWDRKKTSERLAGTEKERETCLRTGDSFVLCLCMSVWECGGL